MIRSADRGVNAKKLLQILAIYVFALIAAVACSPGFSLKEGVSEATPATPPAPAPHGTTPADGAGKTQPASAPGVDFAPKFVKAVKSSVKPDADASAAATALEESGARLIAIAYVFDVDGTTLEVTTRHSKAKPEDYIEKQSGPVIYAVNDVCANEACDEVATTLTKITQKAAPAATSEDKADDAASSAEKIEQSAYYLAGKDADLVKKNEVSQTNFDDINEAFKALKPAEATP